MQHLLGISMFLTSLFLILLVLVQRGRGGGLAGAFGGAGGQSAFGTKAGDMFTKITIVVAFFWIVLTVVSVRMLNSPEMSVLGDGSGPIGSGLDGGDLDRGTGDAATDGSATESSGTETAPDAVPSAEPDAKSTEQPDGGAAATGAEAPASDDPPTTPPATNPAPGE